MTSMHLRRVALCTAFLVAGFFARAAHAETVVTAPITVNTTWTLAGAPYRVDANVFVQSGATLTIVPGVVVEFTRSDSALRVAAGSAIVADAASGSTIVFRPSGGVATPGAWSGLHTATGARVTLRNVRIEYPTTAISLTGPTDTDITIDDVTLFRHGGSGISILEGSGTLTLSRVRSEPLRPSSGSGVTVTRGPDLTIVDSVFLDGAAAVYAVDTNVLMDHSIAARAADYGVRFEARTVGVWSLDVRHCTFFDLRNGVYTTGASPTAGRNITLSIESSIFGDMDVVVRNTSTANTIDFTSFRWNVWWGNEPFYLTVPDDDGGSIRHNALLVDPDGGDFEPTDRSPARYQDPDDPSATAGAIPFAGASSGPGLQGYIYDDTEFPDGTELFATGDVVVTPRATLTLRPNTTVRFGPGDVMAGGAYTGGAELVVEGSLAADGTVSRPVTLTSGAASPARGDWYGVRIVEGAAAFNLQQVSLGYATIGVGLTGSDHTIADSTIHDCSVGVSATGGAPTLIDLELLDNATGVVLNDSTGATLERVNIRYGGVGLRATKSFFTYDTGVVHGMSSHGIRVVQGVDTYTSAALRHLTIAHNGGSGLLLEHHRNYGGPLMVLTMDDCSITQNAGWGVESASDGYVDLRPTYSNVWGNLSGQFEWSAFGSGSGCFAYNPLYADPDTGNYAPTQFSPNRALGSGGGHVGALPYVGHPTPVLMGYLWDDIVFEGGGAPYTVAGDIVVPPGTTVEFRGGPEFRVLPNQDEMGGGATVDRTQVWFLAGSVAVFDPSETTRFTVDAAEPESGTWEGIRVTHGWASRLQNVSIEYADVGLFLEGPEAPEIEDATFLFNSRAAIVASYVAGVVDSARVRLLSSTVVGAPGADGLVLEDSSATVRSSYFTHTRRAISSSGVDSVDDGLIAINNTFVRQEAALYFWRPASRRPPAQIHNNVVVGSTVAPFVDAFEGVASYRVPKHATYNILYPAPFTGTLETNIGNQVVDPFVEDDDPGDPARWWDGRLWAESPGVDAGSDTVAELPARDRAGNPRQLGDGVDIGAFEHVPETNQDPRADSAIATRMVPWNEEITLVGSGAYDPDGTIAAAFWTLSDGTVLPGLTVGHTFGADGPTSAFLTVIDSVGAVDHAVVDLNVNRRPVADAGPPVFQDAAIEPVYFDEGFSNDPDGEIVGWSWDFGDGTPLSAAQYPVHNYATAGVYLVTLTVTDNEGLTASDTTTATVYGVEDTSGPLVVHQEIEDGAPAGSPVSIRAKVYDLSGVSQVILFYRAMGDTIPANVVMTHVAGDDYEALIPGAAVTTSGVEYWILAADAQASAETSITPTGAPDSAVWDFVVDGDSDPPIIVVTPVVGTQPNGIAVGILATITDTSGVGSASLHFRTQDTTAFNAVAMVSAGGSSWTALIPGFAVDHPGVEYYVTAVDGSVSPNAGRSPVGVGFHRFDVTSTDLTPPDISHTPISDGAPVGIAVPVGASVFDRDGRVASVRVAYRAPGVASYTFAALSSSGGAAWSGDIPASAAREPWVEYYLEALDDSGNLVRHPSSAPTTGHRFTVGAGDTTGPVVTHTEIADGQTEGVAIVVTAFATDPSDVDRVQLRFQPAGVGFFQSVDMAEVAPGEFQGTIPAYAVAVPRVDYYLRAFDVPGNETLFPTGGAGSPLSFTVSNGGDATPPVIEHGGIPDGQLVGTDVAVSVVVTDASGVGAVVAWYRAPGAEPWSELPMAHGTGSIWEATIPGDAVALPAVQYWFEASDSSPAENVGVYPTGAPGTFESFTVTESDEAGPTITMSPLSGPFVEGSPILVQAQVHDASGVESASLHYRAEAVGAWSALPMTEGGGTYSASVPDTSVAVGELYLYVSARDVFGNASSLPAGGPDAPEVVIIDPAPAVDRTAPQLLHSPVTVAPAGDDIQLAAVATDESGILGVVAYYRSPGGAWDDLQLEPTGLGSYEVAIPGEAVGIDGVEYYVEAVDASPDANRATVPPGAPTDVFAIAVFGVPADSADDAPADVGADTTPGDVSDGGPPDASDVTGDDGTDVAPSPGGDSGDGGSTPRWPRDERGCTSTGADATPPVAALVLLVLGALPRGKRSRHARVSG